MSDGNGKNKVTAGVLGILLGSLGIHHFYLGSPVTGVICLVSSCVGVGAIIGLVEGIMILTMTDAEFDARYNERTPDTIEFVFQKK